jgi:GNAT superfamily N-acetyltransferase
VPARKPPLRSPAELSRGSPVREACHRPAAACGHDALVLIRPKRPSDEAACVRLLLQSHRADAYPRYWPKDPAAFIAPSYETAAWVAEHGDALVGHVAVHSALDHPTLPAAQRATGLPPQALAVVARLIVAPTARRHGLGEELLARASKHARLCGQRAVLDVTRDASGPIAMYESLGWSRLEPLTLILDNGIALAVWVYLSPDGGLGPATVARPRAHEGLSPCSAPG